MVGIVLIGICLYSVTLIKYSGLGSLNRREVYLTHGLLSGSPVDLTSAEDHVQMVSQRLECVQER